MQGGAGTIWSLVSRLGVVAAGGRVTVCGEHDRNRLNDYL